MSKPRHKLMQFHRPVKLKLERWESGGLLPVVFYHRSLVWRIIPYHCLRFGMGFFVCMLLFSGVNIDDLNFSEVKKNGRRGQ